MRRRTLVAGGALAGAAAVLPRLAKADDAMIAGRFAATLSAHDIDAFAALFAEGYVNHQVSAAAPPPPAGTTPKAASVVYEGRQEGPYYGIEPTHKRLRFTSCDIFRVANGQIVEHWGMGDIAG